MRGRMMPRLAVAGGGGALLLLLLLAGCGGAPHRPASSLSAADRAVLAAYESVRLGLSNDDFRAARRGAVALGEAVKQDAAAREIAHLGSSVQALKDARALDGARDSFKLISTSLEPLVAGVDGYFIMASPPGLGGEWIQTSSAVSNPYLGRVMNSYGSIKK